MYCLKGLKKLMSRTGAYRARRQAPIQVSVFMTVLRAVFTEFIIFFAMHFYGKD